MTDAAFRGHVDGEGTRFAAEGYGSGGARDSRGVDERDAVQVAARLERLRGARALLRLDARGKRREQNEETLVDVNAG